MAGFQEFRTSRNILPGDPVPQRLNAMSHPDPNASPPVPWKHRRRSFYYETAGDLGAPAIDPARTALLVIDVQNKYLDRPDRQSLATPAEQREWDRWDPFHRRMRQIVIPNIRQAIGFFRHLKRDVIFARIACLTPDGRDRSLSQKMPGFNYLLMPHNTHESQFVPELAPEPHDIVVAKTTDSALTGTNLRLVLHNMGIAHVFVAGIFTDQCVASTVRSLADESFHVVALEDCCAAGSDELHEAELTIINNIYCHVMTWAEAADLLNCGPADQPAQAPASLDRGINGQRPNPCRTPAADRSANANANANGATL
jgi:nicotinamidase-related amidase